MKRPRSAPVGLAALAIVVASITAGCGWLQDLVPGLGVLGSPSPEPSHAFAPTPPLDCAVEGQGTLLLDEASGFSVCLPANWRRLAPGDDGWLTIYGVRDPVPEQDVASGVIQDYALPLEPRDEDRLVNLAVYVRPIPVGTTLPELGDAYQDTLERVGGHVIVRSTASVPAGPIEHLTALRPHTLGGSGFDDVVDAYILLNGQRTYHLVFVCSAEWQERYAPVFLSVVDSFRYVTPGASSP